MGWTFTKAHNYNSYGYIDRKKECDQLFGTFMKVLKSSVVGGDYYAAVQDLVSEKVHGIVIKTSVRYNDAFNFGYKIVPEEAGPVDCKCPIGILNLLSDTDSECANNWRSRCLENTKNQNSKKKLCKLPVGSVIEVTFRGKNWRLKKMKPSYPYKQTWWRVENSFYSFPKRYITSNYRIVSD